MNSPQHPKEKKYLVTSFTDIMDLLKQSGAKIAREVTSTHYYGQQDGNDVEKFVVYADHAAIHILKESNGTYALTQNTPITGKEAGFAWLKERGYHTVNIVQMAYIEYAYKNGVIGLYTIDDFLRSVILYFPENDHPILEKEFGLDRAQVISLPYNKYLKTIGRIRSAPLD